MNDSFFNRYKNRFVAAVWIFHSFESDIEYISNSLKRMNVVNFALCFNDCCFDDFRTRNSFLFCKKCNALNEDIVSILNDYSIREADLLVISDDQKILQELLTVFPSLNTSNVTYVKNYVIINEISSCKPVDLSKSFDWSKYDRLKQNGSKRLIKRFLKKYYKSSEFACKELVSIYDTQGNWLAFRKAICICKRNFLEIPELALYLANCYHDGKSVRRNQDKAIDILSKSNLDSFPSAFGTLVDYLLERGYDCDISQAMSVCQSKSKLNPNLIVKLAELYQNGKYVKVDIDRSIDLYLSAVNLNVGIAKNKVVDLLIERGRDNDLEMAFKICESYSTLGDLWAQARLARMYAKGIHVQKDVVKGAYLMKGSYLGGVKWAKNELISLLVEGDDLVKEIVGDLGMNDDKDYLYAKSKNLIKNPNSVNEAIDLMRKSIALGKNALNELADFLIIRGSDEDLLEAYDICVRGANSGNPWSMGRLSRMYRDGIYVKPDLDKAICLMRVPSKKRIPWARNEMIDMLVRRANKEDYVEAYQLSLEGVFEKDSWCCVKLSRLYSNGKGIEKNLDLAIILMRTAYVDGVPVARNELRELLKSRGSAEDKKESQKL